MDEMDEIASAPSEASPSPSRAPRRSVANPPRRDPPPPRRADADEAGATRGDAARIAGTRAPRWMDEPSDAYTIFISKFWMFLLKFRVRIASSVASERLYILIHALSLGGTR